MFIMVAKNDLIDRMLMAKKGISLKYLRLRMNERLNRWINPSEQAVANEFPSYEKAIQLISFINFT